MIFQYHAKLYATTLVTLLSIDLFWITVIAKSFYQRQLGPLLKENPSLIPGLLFYVFFAAALLVFVVFPAIQTGQSIQKTFFLGFFFGLIVYSAYDLTNHATLVHWSLIMTIVDMAWGAMLSGTVSLIAYIASRYL